MAGSIQSARAKTSISQSLSFRETEGVIPRALPPGLLILGLGNDLLTDDSIGLRITDLLQGVLKQESRFSVRKSGEAGLALLDLIVGFETLVIVDAIQTGRGPPGTLHRLDLVDLKTVSMRSPHFIGVAEVLALGHGLALSMPKSVIIFAIEVRDPLTVSETLTAELEAALPNIVSRIAAEVSRLAR